MASPCSRVHAIVDPLVTAHLHTAGLQPLKLPPPPGAAGSPIKAGYAVPRTAEAGPDGSKLPGSPAQIQAHAGGPPPLPGAEQPPSRIPQPTWASAGREADGSAPPAGDAAAAGPGAVEEQAALPPPPMMGRPPLPPGAPQRALHFGAAGRPGVPAFGAPGGARPSAFVPGAADSSAAEASHPSSAASSVASGPPPFRPGPPSSGSMASGEPLWQACCTRVRCSLACVHTT